MPEDNNTFRCPTCGLSYQNRYGVFIKLPIGDQSVLLGCIDCIHKYINNAAQKLPLTLNEEKIISLLGNIEKEGENL